MVLAVAGGVSRASRPARRRAHVSRPGRGAGAPGRAGRAVRGSGSVRLRRRDLAQTYLVRLDGRADRRRASRSRCRSRSRSSAPIPMRASSRRSASASASATTSARRSSTAAIGPSRSSRRAPPASTRRACATRSSAPAGQAARWLRRPTSSTAPRKKVRYRFARLADSRMDRAVSHAGALANAASDARDDGSARSSGSGSREVDAAWRRSFGAPTLTAVLERVAPCVRGQRRGRVGRLLRFGFAAGPRVMSGRHLRLLGSAAQTPRRARASPASWCARCRRRLGRGDCEPFAARPLRSDRAPARACRAAGARAAEARAYARSARVCGWSRVPRREVGRRFPFQVDESAGTAELTMADGKEPSTDAKPGILDPDDRARVHAVRRGRRAPRRGMRRAVPGSETWREVQIDDPIDGTQRVRLRRRRREHRRRRDATLRRLRSGADLVIDGARIGSGWRARCRPTFAVAMAAARAEPARRASTARGGDSCGEPGHRSLERAATRAHELIAWRGGPVRVVRRSRHDVDLLRHRHPHLRPASRTRAFYPLHVFAPGSLTPADLASASSSARSRRWAAST